MNTPLPTANEALAQLHDRFAGEYLSRFADSRVMHRARQILCRLLPQGEPRREAVAQALCLSEERCRGVCRRRAAASSSCWTTRDATGRAVSCAT